MNLRAQSIPERSDTLAALCKASGDALRLNVLRALASDSFGVLELAQIFDIGQSGMSHHLKVLAQAELVATRREGNAIFYRRALPDSLRLGGRLHTALLDEVDDLTLPPAVQARIAQVQQRRAATSQDFFQRVEEKFRESLLAMLDKLNFGPAASALEVGPGDGGFLPDLARRFGTVTALDNSPTMLELARQVCQREGLDNVNLQLADALDATDVAADCVVLNMVLHHFSDPALALRLLAKRVKAGGSLLVTELCSHDQGWARDACGDLWLGFEQDDLARWANVAGLVPGDSLYVGLRNGFQIQVRHFQRATGDIHHR